MNNARKYLLAYNRNLFDQLHERGFFLTVCELGELAEAAQSNVINEIARVINFKKICMVK